jgi:hypothetical protein
VTLEWNLVDRTKLEPMIEQHCSGARDHGHVLYKLLNLALWQRAYLKVPPGEKARPLE